MSLIEGGLKAYVFAHLAARIAVIGAAEGQFWQSAEQPIQEFAAEVFPEKDPSRAFITLRVDFVATRADGSAVRIHPRQAEGSTYSGKQLVGLAPR